jgi:hypothetical protein
MRIIVSFVLQSGMRIVCLAFVALVVLLPPHDASCQNVPAHGSTSSSNIPLDSDPRLQRAVTISATDITLGDLLLRFSTGGLILSADGNCKQQSLQLHLIHRPLSALMRSLAALIPGSWEPRVDGTGYFFIMSPSAVVKRRRWWDLFLGERERAKEAQRKKVLEAMRTPGKSGVAYDNGVESPEMEEQDQRYNRFFLDLPADLKSLIAEQMVDFALSVGATAAGSMREP